ncbi:PRC-barrel domain containing protein [Streptomyces sp. NBC_00090]|uniref:PRC-barrel domain containing protein n=1 Tax=Streptomyces sp. NBC_00090 TaxID=2903619 RepID=UPI00324690E7
MYVQDSGYTSRQTLVGFTVEAADGTIGHVDRQQDQPGMQHLVVDTSVWMFGRSILIPAGAVAGIDTETRTVKVSGTREEIKAAPGSPPTAKWLTTASAVGNYYLSLRRPLAP